jgi:DNA invertase Pin-like site-specific DNA recombinase
VPPGIKNKESQSAVNEGPELQNMLNQLRQGDVVVVWKPDRLGRSLKHLIDLIRRARGYFGFCWVLVNFYIFV